MASSRRKFLQQSTMSGAVLGTLGAPEVGNGQGARDHVVPTSRAKVLMALFKLDYPIFQAPHGAPAGPELASAVSNAGAMGAMAFTGATPQHTREAVAKVRSLTKRPFIVNYLLSFDAVSLPAAMEAGAPVVQFSWGLSSKDLISMVRRGGAKFGVQIGNADGARAALDLGADYLVCQGNEAGGHVQSSTPLYELLPSVLGEAKQTPVLAAGGISNGQKIWQSLRAGAFGAVLGTRFLATKESLAHPDYKGAITHAHAKDTALSVCFQDGAPAAIHRALRNRTFLRWEAAGCPPIGNRPGEGDILATRPDGTKIARYSFATPLQGFEGAITDLAMYAGQGVDDVNDLPAASDLVRRLWAECVAASRH